MSQQQVETIDAPREGQSDAAETTTPASPVVREPADEAVETVERLVPVSEAKKYRKRAQAAEATLEEVKAQLAHNEEQIRRSDAMIAALERRVAIDEALVESDAVDLDAARLLVEQSIAGGEAKDIDGAVAELQRRKPLMFRRRKFAATALAARETNGHTPHREQLVRAAAEASSSGHRMDVLRYLRLRRRS